MQKSLPDKNISIKSVNPTTDVFDTDFDELLAREIPSDSLQLTKGEITRSVVLALDATQIASDFLPTTNNLFDVGSSALRWAEIYGVILNISGTSTLADVNISGTSTLTGAFVFNEDSADLDARFEGNGVSNLLKIDGGNDQVEIHGGQVHNVTTVNAATYDLLLTDYIVSVTHTTTAAVTSLTLPTAQAVTGRVVVIKDAGGNASANNITIDTQGSETIDGASTNVISTDFGAISLYTDGTNWFTF